jgi:hypothetical protein
MFQQIEIKEPVEKAAEDWDLLADSVLGHFSTFRAVGHNIYGIRRRLITADAIDDPKKGNIGHYLELGPKGIEQGSHHPLQLRVTAAGMPHRVLHNFGYWHINDKDELYLPIPGEGPQGQGYFVIVQGRPTGKENDSFAWYCEKCMTLLYDFVVETGEVGLAGFWKGEQEAVRRYNADVRLRTCPECAHVNPRGYCWNKAKDTPEEAQARLYW